MERCTYEFCARARESKRNERTREEQLAHRRVSLAVFLLEEGARLEEVKSPTELGELVASKSTRLSGEDFLSLAELLQAKFGPAFVRQAGLPVRGPKLRVA